MGNGELRVRSEELGVRSYELLYFLVPHTRRPTPVAPCPPHPSPLVPPLPTPHSPLPPPHSPLPTF
ncbi:hypothetical protein PI95_007110 [Hassallia byssoidea VB512170]|uniref:Uncharacterized protein n=1 Tax=Hassallia byssoidea VB512170 TaxID=1304833 RepID=A0A846H5U9_9CYAN|nr:hypothetical protein [Hassalia byssoidea]NEU72348.1 hypothetical protein [Hassalia byssoidea VB512170]